MCSSQPRGQQTWGRIGDRRRVRFGLAQSCTVFWPHHYQKMTVWVGSQAQCLLAAPLPKMTVWVGSQAQCLLAAPLPKMTVWVGSQAQCLLGTPLPKMTVWVGSQAQCLLAAPLPKMTVWVGSQAQCLLGTPPPILLVGCLTSQQQASVSQGRICSDNCTCCHTEIEVADQTFYLTQSQYTDTGPTSPSADPITPGAWQGSHWSANV